MLFENKINVDPIGYYNDIHGFLHDEMDKDCYYNGGCNMQPVYTEEQVREMLTTMLTKEFEI